MHGNKIWSTDLKISAPTNENSYPLYTTVEVGEKAVWTTETSTACHFPIHFVVFGNTDEAISTVFICCLHKIAFPYWPFSDYCDHNECYTATNSLKLIIIILNCKQKVGIWSDQTRLKTVSENQNNETAKVKQVGSNFFSTWVICRMAWYTRFTFHVFFHPFLYKKNY